MGAVLHYPAPVHHVDHIGRDDGRQSVGYDHGGAVTHERLQRRLYVTLAGRIQRRSCLVQYQHARLMQYHPGDGQALPLPAGQPEPSLTDKGVIPLGHLHDPVVDEGRFGRLDHLVPRSLRSGVEQVLLHSVVEQIAVLGHEADDRRQVHLPDLFDIRAVDRNGAFRNVIEPGHQVGQGCFAGPTGAHERGQLAGRNVQADTIQRPQTGLFFQFLFGVFVTGFAVRPGVVDAHRVERDATGNSF